MNRSKGLYDQMNKIAFVLLVLVVFTAPCEKTVLLPGLGSITRGIGLLLAIVAVPMELWVSERRHIGGLSVLVGGLVAWAAITCFWSVSLQTSLERLGTYLQLCVLLWLIQRLCRTDVRYRTLCQAYVCGAFLACGATLISYYRDRVATNMYQRYSAAGFDPNDLGLTLALSIPLALFLSSGVHIWQRAFNMLHICSIPVAIFLTASRMAAGVMCIAFLFLPWSARRWVPRQKLAALIAVPIAVGITLFAVPVNSWVRIVSAEAELTSGTLNDRTVLWAAGMQVLSSSPLVGVGMGAYPTAIAPYVPSTSVDVAHNTFLSVLVEEGGIGFLLLITILIELLRLTIALPAYPRAMWLTVLVSWSIGVATLTWEYRKPTWILLGILAAYSGVTTTERCLARKCPPLEKTVRLSEWS